MSELEIENEKPKRSRRPVQWMVFATAAVFALALGIGIGIGAGMSKPAAVQSNYDVGVMLTATSIIEGATGTANAVFAPTVVQPEGMMPTATVIPVEDSEDSFRLTATSFVHDVTMTAYFAAGGPTWTETPPPTGTSTPTVTVTATPLATATVVLAPVTTSVAGYDRNTPPPDATLVGGVNSSAVQLTATALAPSLLTQQAGASDLTMTAPAPAGSGGDIILALPTSDEFGAYALPTATPRDLGGGDDSGLLVLGTPTPASLAAIPGKPDLVMTSTASYIAVTPESGRDDGDDKEVGAAAEPVIAGTTTTEVDSTTMLPPTAVPDFSQIQLQPLKAGEIDDNADWDTYTLYRRNFLEMYSGLILDVDITGRQIIKVVDVTGLPVLGAKVEVLYGTQLVSQTTTYATGMTLFFPNAKPEFSRMDTFRVVVTKNGRSTETTLNIERIDDILTITLN